MLFDQSKLKVKIFFLMNQKPFRIKMVVHDYK